jgi:hypothetical protein
MTDLGPLTIQLRLVGTAKHIAFWLRLLDELGYVHHVSDPQPGRANQIRVYATVSRRAPLTGGKS